MNCKLSHKKYGLDIILKPLIDDLIYVEENGIVFNLPSGIIKVYFMF